MRKNRPIDATTSTPAPTPAAPAADTPEQDGPRWHWVVIDTMGDTEPSLILDGNVPRNFSRLNRASIARNGTVNRLLPTLVAEVRRTGQTASKYFPSGPDEHMQRLIAVPVLGPSGDVHAVAAWAGPLAEPLPRMPIIGALSWTPSGVVTATPPAQFLFRDPSGDLLSGHTIPQMLSHFDIWDDRSTFLAMFNVTKLGAQAPTDSWCGTATKTYEDGSPHHLFLAARATGTDTGRVVRAVVADITGGINPARPDLTLAAIRHMPIAPGHALALCDLKTGFIHEWLTAPTSPLASWRHHNPEFSVDDRIAVVTACFDLASGRAETASIRAHVRFSPTSPWIELIGHWTLLMAGDRPQALIDITPLSEISTPVVADCPMCQDMAQHIPAP
ncbi:GAF domain-containing protein [Nocardia sp. NBC_01327]|uniref:GAF domain-containing protein n=1 Tax=Nocardia sp. NBC_01327 TaxID=2903593 RepID=UPI002E109CD3|nr:DUF5593 domain-containing protein [Nocardia sp. NBC_01327]